MSDSIPSGADPFGAIADEFVEAFRQGKHPSVEEFARRYPAHADEIREMLPALVLMERAKSAGLENPGSGCDTAATVSAAQDPQTSDRMGVGNGLPAEWTAFLAPAQAPDEIGRLGPYRVLAVLGSGGMGVVFEAEDPQLGRRVALKAMLPARAASPSARERFSREARSAAGLKHPHVVTIFDVGEDRGVPFLAMELLEGESLDARLGREGRLPVPEVLRIGREVAAGLAAAHDKGLIHRDIKPANLWLEGQLAVGQTFLPAGTVGQTFLSAGAMADSNVCPRMGGHVKILDFGLARALGEATRLSQPGTVLGTPGYLAPEQAGDGEVDFRCDLFSLGCVLYRMGTGRRPFQGKDVLSTLRAVATQQPPPPRELNPDIPEGLNDLILSLLSKDPAGRPASAAAVVESLRRLEGIPAGGPAPEWGLKGPHRPARGKPPRWRVGLVLVLVGALAAGGVLVFRGRHDREAPVGGMATSAPSPAAVNKAGGKEGVIEPEAFHWEPGAPLSSAVAVQRPTPIRGLASWALVPRTAGEGPVAVAYHPDGRRYASLDPRGIVRLCAAGTGRLLRVLVGPPIGDRSISWSPNGRAIGWSPNGKYLATSHDRAVRVWKDAAGRLLRSLEHPAMVCSLAWTPDSRTLACGLDDGTIRLWDPAVGEERGRFTGHTAAVLDVKWSPDGKSLASASDDRSVRLWSAESGNCLRVLLSPGSKMSGVAWSPTGEEIATVGGDQAPRILDAARGEVHWSAGGHRADEAVVWLADGQTLATVGRDDAISLWKRTQKEPVRKLQGNRGWISNLMSTPDGKKLLCGCWCGAVQEWDLASGVAREDVFRGLPGWIRPSWSPDGRKVASHRKDGNLTLWETDSARKVLALQAGPVVEAVAWSADGRRLAAAAGSPAIPIWDTTSGQLLQKLEGHTREPIMVAWSPDGKVLASAGGDRTVRLWDGLSGQPIRTLTGHTDLVFGLAWRPDSRQLASCGFDGTVRVWQTDAEAAVRVLDARAGRLGSVAWSPDGKVLATAGDDKMVRLWDARSGERIEDWAGNEDSLRGVSFSVDGLLAAVGLNAGLRVWEGSTGKLLIGPQGDVQASEGLAWSPDGKTLAGGGRRGIVYFWDARGRLRASLLTAEHGSDIAIGAEGHFQAEPGAEQFWVVAALTESGEFLALGLEEFAARYGWKNDPSRVQLLARPAAAPAGK
jgi:WD40 repeat protein/serine/threonine protein kinase